jgi:hypothetical protein
MDHKEIRWVNLAEEGKVLGYCEHDDGPSGSIDCMEILD